MAGLRRLHCFKRAVRSLSLWPRQLVYTLTKALIRRKRSTKFVGVASLVLCFWLYSNLYANVQQTTTAGIAEAEDSAETLKAPWTWDGAMAADREEKSWRTTQSQRQRQMEEYCRRHTHSRAQSRSRLPPRVRSIRNNKNNNMNNSNNNMNNNSNSMNNNSNNIFIPEKNSPTSLRPPIHNSSNTIFIPRFPAPANHLLLIPDRKLLYCPVEKSASTFLRRFLYSLASANGSDRVVSPFAVPIRSALTYKFQSLRTFGLQHLERSLGTSVRLLVARDPYSRVFSAYVDKLLVPNAYFWETWGRPIARRRRRLSHKSGRCGHDVTFPEFVDYVIAYLHSVDSHVMPISRLCSPCAANFSLIGRLDTLTSDFQHLTSQLNVTVANFSAESMGMQFSQDALEDSTRSAFRFQAKLKSCVTRHAMTQSLWLKLQLRGIIEDRIALPLTPRESQDISYFDFLQVLREARRNSSDPGRLRAQKVQAMQSAFAQVPPAHISKLVMIYQADFEMFGYEKYPSFISQPME